MRWSCPHCGINLAISDDKLGPGWSFSRCYKCAGFALVRRAEVNLIKVDRAPAGENVILPEATESPLEILSEDATKNLANLRRESSERAAARAAISQIQGSSQQLPPAAPPVAHAPAFPQPDLMGLGGAEHTMELPMPTRTTARSLVRSGVELGKRLLPGAIALAAITATGSGIYLFLQGQALWESARIEMRKERAENVQAIRNEMAMAQQTSAQPNNPGSDQLRVGAMAPSRIEARTEERTETPVAQLTVRAKDKNADLHSGPGSLYPIVGYVNPGHSLQVLDWSDRWFKISLGEPRLPGVKAGHDYAWIRTDLVQVLTQPAQ